MELHWDEEGAGSMIRISEVRDTLPSIRSTGQEGGRMVSIAKLTRRVRVADVSCIRNTRLTRTVGEGGEVLENISPRGACFLIDTRSDHLSTVPLFLWGDKQV